MPYAVPSPSSSPVATMTFAPSSSSPLSSPKKAPLQPSSPLLSPRTEQKRPTRHHQRSHSSEPVASTSSFIFVSPASPENERVTSPRSYIWSKDGATSLNSGYSTIPRQQRRVRMSALTPAGPGPASPSSSSGPSSMEDSSNGLRGRKEGPQRRGDDRTPTGADPLFINSFPFGPNSSSPSPAPTPDDEAWAAKPALMVRKKSGELVRPSLKADVARRDFSKPRSAPATPTCPKYVHFDTQLEHVKHFLAQQRPAAVSRSGSPVETETEDEPEAFPFPAMATAQAGVVKLLLPNFPSPAARAAASPKPDAYVETLEMTPDGKSIRGVVRVQNLAFEKWVAVRFTLDHWQTVSEVSAEHHESLPGGKEDRFAFTIRLQDLLARIEEKTMFLAVRYTVGGREVWDNNDGQNYQVGFRKVPPPGAGHRNAASAANAAASRAAAASAAERRKNAWSVTNAGQAADRMADLRRELDRLVREDNFDDDEEDVAASLGVSAAPSAMGLGLGGRRPGSGPEARSYSEGGVSLSGRYDFGNSLKMYTDRGSGMKERPAGSPSFKQTLPLPNASTSFFDPVSTSPQRPRAPPLPAVNHPPSPPKSYATTTLINGMPATVYDPSLTSAPSSVIYNSHREGPASSPLLSPRPQLQPDFGLPSTSAARGSAIGSSETRSAYFSPTLPTFEPQLVGGARPRSPDPSASSYFYAGSPIISGASSPVGVGSGGFLPLQDIAGGSSGFATGAPRTRYNSYPVGSAKAEGVSSNGGNAGSGLNPQPTPRSPAPQPYSPLMPPSFRDNRDRSSPYASPAPSSPSDMSPAGSPRPHSPVSSGLKLRSPPPERSSDNESSDAEAPQLWSPTTTDSNASTSSLTSSSSAGTARGGISPFSCSRRTGSEESVPSSLLSSPESDATSVPPDSPGYGEGLKLPAEAAKQRPSNALEFSQILDRYRFHLNAQPPLAISTSADSSLTSSLGLSAPAPFVASPPPAAPADFFSFAASSPLSLPTHGESPSSAATSVASSPTTPKRLSPLAQVAAAAATSSPISPAPPANGTTIVS
ncbi:hypothetical protein JCM10213_007800 [Rhodosporidiobolus nylandii]